MQIDLNDKITRFLIQEYVNQICNYQSEEELNFDVYKLIHSFQVLEMAQNLIDNACPSLSTKIRQHILDAALLHDIGRCHEFRKGIHLKVDHGKIGAKLVQQHFPKMTIEKETTFFHNRLPSNKDPKSCQPVLDYVRDADMLANLQNQINRPGMWLKHILREGDKFVLAPHIDKEILTASKEKRPAQIDKIKIKNILTMWLWELCWIYNLRTPAGIRYAKKEKVFIHFKQIIIKKIIPLTTKDKEKQKELIQKIQKAFPDKLFF